MSYSGRLEFMDSTYEADASVHFHRRMDCAPKEPSRVRSDEIVLGKARCEAMRSKIGGRGVINKQESSIGQPQMPLEHWWRAWRAAISRES